jgi:hypothetical protein
MARVTRKSIKTRKNYGMTRPKRGGKKSVKRGIKNKTIRSKRKNRKMRGGNDDECPICLEKFTKTNPGIMVHPPMPIGSKPHLFHSDCINASMEDGNTKCPLCTTDIPVSWTDVSTPDGLKEYLSGYDGKITTIVTDEQLSEEKKKEDINKIKTDITLLERYVAIMNRVTEANKLAVNRIFEDYIGENGRIDEALFSIQKDEEHAAETAAARGEEALEFRSMQRRGDQPTSGSLARR